MTHDIPARWILLATPLGHLGSLPSPFTPSPLRVFMLTFPWVALSLWSIDYQHIPSACSSGYGLDSRPSVRLLHFALPRFLTRNAPLTYTFF